MCMDAKGCMVMEGKEDEGIRRKINKLKRMRGGMWMKGEAEGVER